MTNDFFLLQHNGQNLFAMYELPEIRWIVDRAAIADTIVAFANAFDAFILAKSAVAFSRRNRYRLLGIQG